MKKTMASASLLPVITAFFGFFIMGFVDVVGIASNYVKDDFELAPWLVGLLPMLVFLWFAVFSIPTGVLMGKIGRKNTALISIALTAVAMFLPYMVYNFNVVMCAFVLLGIGNTILQVSLNPLVAAMFSKERTASILTLGQFIKAISSFLGPITAGVAASYFGDWKFAFVIFGTASCLSVLLFFFSKVEGHSFENTPTTFVGVLGLLKTPFITVCFFGIFLVVGFDVTINVAIPEILKYRAKLPLSVAGYGVSVYFTARTLGTFFGTLILLKVKPMKFLQVSLLVAVVVALVFMFSSESWMLLALIFALGFACASIFAIIFSAALQRLPHKTNEISALMIMGVAGGAVVPFLRGVVHEYMGFNASLFIILLTLVLLLLLSFRLGISKNQK